MESIFFVGIILFVGFVLGELAKLCKLPKVSGYIIAGILLNPKICWLTPKNFTEHTQLITDIALAFITFSVGGTLRYSKLKKLGKSILTITVFEAEFAFIFVAIAFIFFGPLIVHMPRGVTLFNFFIPFGLLIGALAAPTDPSATLAVIHEYKAKGEVTSTIMGVAAFDDILGILNYSLAVVVATVLINHSSLTADALITQPILLISGSIIIGIVFGLLLNIITKVINRETEGMFIVLIFGLLLLCFGTALLLKMDELLSTVTMGIVVVNFNKMHVKIFNMLERYTEELIFVLFFTISGMHLDFSLVLDNWVFILLFFVFRSAGKYLGALMGGVLSNASSKIRKYVGGGLIPQGGIVVGLALLIHQNGTFSSFSSMLINIIIGVTVIHELIGPVLSRIFISQAGEIQKTS